MTSTIYGLVNASSREIRYVGRTCKTPEHRMARHIWKARERDGASVLRVSRWIRACDYKIDVVTLEVDPADPAQAERDWIAKLRAEGCDLTNLNAGGEGSSPQTFLLSPEHREKISAANRRRFSDPAARMAIAEANKRRGPMTDETREKMSLAQIGKRHTPESRKKMSDQRKGRAKSEETKARMKAAVARRVPSIRADWDRRKATGAKILKLSQEDANEIRRRGAAGEVRAQIARDYGISSSLVSHICTGRAWR